jgi:hypothetical protein
MTDRELLEKAAKAAGIDVPKKLNNWLTYGDKYGFQWWNMDGTRTEKTFNPLNDDGDALRLAVKLHMCVTSFTDEIMVGCVIAKEGRNFQEALNSDPCAATRRAIVRAAAAIGEQTP